jgi:hypothetical protein
MRVKLGRAEEFLAQNQRPGEVKAGLRRAMSRPPAPIWM